MVKRTIILFTGFLIVVTWIAAITAQVPQPFPVFKVKIKNSTGTQELTDVIAGDVVLMVITTTDSLGNSLKINIDTAEATASSSYPIFDTSMKPFTLPRNFIADSVSFPFIFKFVPRSGQLERISVIGVVYRPVDSSYYPVSVYSKGIKIRPGIPSQVKFYDPVSHGHKVIYSDKSENIIVKVCDRFNNPIDNRLSTDVKLRSTKPAIGDIDGPSIKSSDDSGTVYFKVKVTGGVENDSFPVIASLAMSGYSDTIECVVGQTPLSVLKSTQSISNRNSRFQSVNKKYTLSGRTHSDSKEIKSILVTKDALQKHYSLSPFNVRNIKK